MSFYHNIFSADSKELTVFSVVRTMLADSQGHLCHEMTSRVYPDYKEFADGCYVLTEIDEDWEWIRDLSRNDMYMKPGLARHFKAIKGKQIAQVCFEGEYGEVISISFEDGSEYEFNYEEDIQ